MLAPGNVGWESILACIMMGHSQSNADIYMDLGFWMKEDGRKDLGGRPWGRFGSNFKGARFWTGGDVERVPLKWYNLCATFHSDKANGTHFQYLIL